MKTIRSTAWALAAAFALQAEAAPVRYDVKLVASFHNRFSQPTGLNDAGQVVGMVVGETAQGFASGPQGEGLFDPCPPKVASCTPVGIDAAGDVAMQIIPDRKRPLSTLGAVAAFDGSNLRYTGDLGSPRTDLWGMSPGGQLTGMGTTATGRRHAIFASDAGQPLVDLGVPAGDWNSIGQAVNELGQVAGYLTIADHVQHAMFALPGGPVRDIGTLGGFTARASAISANGYVAGFSSQATSSNFHAFACSVSAPGLVDLGTLGGGLSMAFGVNSAGQVVGQAERADGSSAAFIVDLHDMTLVDLNTVADVPRGVTLAIGYAINERGQIAVQSSDDSVYLLTPR